MFFTIAIANQNCLIGTHTATTATIFVFRVIGDKKSIMIVTAFPGICGK